MASRRMLATSISVSEQVADLHDDFTRLLFTWMIAHADDWGVLTGSPAKVKALVVPMSDHTIAEVDAALDDMERHALIWRYNGPDGRPWVQFRTWEEHQSGLHKRTSPKVPRYADVMGYTKETPGTSGNVRELPSEQNRTEQNRKRRESMATADAAPPSSADVTSTEDDRPAEQPPQEQPTPLPVKRARQRDAIFDALVALMGYEPQSKSERSGWGGCVKELKELAATPDEIALRGKRYGKKYGAERLTVYALVKHWGEFSQEPTLATVTAPRPAANEPKPLRLARNNPFNAAPAPLEVG